MVDAPSLEFERDMAELEQQIEKLQELARQQGLDVDEQLQVLEDKMDQLKKEKLERLGPMDRVQMARHPQRPYTLDYISRVFTDFVELHGDRAFRDDEAVVAGWARLDGRTVMVVGHQKGRDMKENLRRNFGMPHPEGYRKALRLMQQAEKFGHPVITFIDTPGAYPGIGAEERGQAEAIAMNLREMARLRVPLVSIVVGEGGSGGALGLGVTNRILMLENSVYSVISPEGCAAILWKTGEARNEAAEALKLTAPDLSDRLGVVDDVIEEPVGGAHTDWDEAARRVGAALRRHLDELAGLSAEELREQRWNKFESIGEWRVAEPAGT